jgi:hypothetical protein
MCSVGGLDASAVRANQFIAETVATISRTLFGYSTMKAQAETKCETHVSKSLAAEDLRCGDFVSILSEVVEFPSFFWSCDPQLVPPNEPVRMHCNTSDCGQPLKVKAICLPFIFVKKPCGRHRTLDVRQQRLVRLDPDYARPVWKTLSKETLSGRLKAALTIP